ncbi:hypothetical protein [uncultured Draconibacterium sp.]|uniref:hypothetical protein n=1 Tax=uncultured Draconibacterium sp. TaxID=1573823 RepID=UPI0025E3E397|nr:hypothetical protein [uncultured Draconibacterium sp.]
MYKISNRFLVVLMVLFVCFSVAAQEETESDLAKKIQNPVANLISLPFQYNIDFGANSYDPIQGVYHDRAIHTLNIQPVYPFSFEKFNLITRTIIPIKRLPLDIEDSKSGLGDISLNLYITSPKPHKVTFAYGLSLLLPTAMNGLGSGKWSAGPGAVMLVQPNGWTLGALAQNNWSFAGKSNRADVNLFYSQIFISKNLSKGWYLNSAPVITANWEADSGNQWTIPLGAGFGRLFTIGQQPVNAQLGWYNYIEKPVNGPENELRFQVVLLFPK